MGVLFKSLHEIEEARNRTAQEMLRPFKAVIKYKHL